MKNVVFVAPYFMDATERFISAATQVPGARVGLVSCDPVEKLDATVRQGLAAHVQIEGIKTRQIAAGVQQMAGELGSVDRLLGMLEQILESLGEVRQHMGIPGMRAEAADNFRDKSRMKNVLRAAGIPCARHQLVESVPAGLQFTAQIGFPVVVKPPAGAGARGTYRCETESTLSDCLQTLGAGPGNPILIEEFIQGREHSFDSICLGGEMVWSSISHYFPGPLEVVREPWIQWCVIIPRETDAPQYQAIRKYAPVALHALGMQTGLSHMEWFLRDDGSVAVSEVGARPPGAQFTSLISWAHDIDLYKAWAHLMIHDEFQTPQRKFAAGAAYLRGMGRGRVTQVHGLDKIARELGEIVVESQIPKTGQATTGTYEGEGHIIVRHPDTAVVEQALTQIINNVQVELSESPV